MIALRPIHIILLSFLIKLGVGSKSVKFRAVKSIVKPLSHSLSSTEFEVWFNSDNIPVKLLHANPGILRSKKLDSNKYLGYLAPINFPGIVIKSVVIFDTIFEKNIFTASCSQKGLNQTIEGNPLFVKLVSKLLPTVTTKNVCKYDSSNKQLINEASLDIFLSLPAWFPIPPQPLESAGSRAIQIGIDRDMAMFLDNLVNNFVEDKIEEARNSI